MCQCVCFYNNNNNKRVLGHEKKMNYQKGNPLTHTSLLDTRFLQGSMLIFSEQWKAEGLLFHAIVMRS